MGLLTAALFACKKGDDQPCPNRYKDVENATAGVTCTCSASDVTAGSVWGDGVYTTDSKICRAGVHAGAIGMSGGKVTVKPAAGCPSYNGTSKNGVTTGKWGKYDGSYFFEGHGSATCAAPPTSDKCPARFKNVPNVSASTSVTCECESNQTGSGSVWGDGMYTTDSSICRAAVHAGAIPATGGKVTAKAAAGCSKYEGSEKNGVKTSKWGSYNMSFHFPSAGTAKCP